MERCAECALIFIPGLAFPTTRFRTIRTQRAASLSCRARTPKYEGGYSRAIVGVFDAEAKEAIHALTFVVNGDTLDLLSTREYLETILQGAPEHGLPGEYCKQLAGTKTAAQEKK
jgi:hypothetical protein